MKLNHLRDVLAIAERGSLRAAARALVVPPSALSRSVAELERELGVPLFERQARGVQMTEAGQLFVLRANAVQNELRRARDEIEQLRGKTHGCVSVCLSSVPHFALLPQVLRPFYQRYPDVDLEVLDGVYPTIESEIKAGKLDCYIGPPPEHVPADFVSEKLFDNTRIIIGRKNHPLGGARSLRDLVSARWVRTSYSYKAEEEIGPLFASHGLPPPRLVMKARSTMTFMVALAYSDMITMLPQQWLEFAPTSALLQKFDIKEPLSAPPIAIVRRAGLPLTPAAEYFCDLIRRGAAQIVARGRRR